ncbi:MAG: lanthionine synthetase LanC family protein [Acidobacteriota bacterium]
MRPRPTPLADSRVPPMDPTVPRAETADWLAVPQSQRPRLLEAAQRCGRHLSEGSFDLDGMGTGLFAGSSGIDLFRARLAAATGETTDAARRIDSLLTRLEGRPEELATVGLTGWGGVTYAAAHVAAVCGDSALGRRAAAWAPAVTERLGDDIGCELVDGVAGMVLGLLALHQVEPCPRVLATAVRGGELILWHAQPIGDGLGWPLVLHGDWGRAFAGLAQGGAGVVLALVRLWQATGDPRFQTSARAAMAYERTLFPPEDCPWRTRRERRLRRLALEVGSSVGVSAWWHGAAGIGLTRLALPEDLLGPGGSSDLRMALRSTADLPSDGGPGLAHGVLGRLELQARARAQGVTDIGGQGLETQLEGVLDALDAELQKDAGCGGMEPGLWTGLAGVGYGLLRLTDPAGIPSVMTLDRPLV